MSAQLALRGLRIAFAGGGTGGHIVPGRHLLAHADGALGDVLWFCTGRPVETRAFAGLESELGATSLARIALALEPEGGGAPSLASLAWRTWPAYRVARSELLRHRSQVLLGLGGFTCLPAVLAAWSMRIPVGLLEINAAPGRATRTLTPFANRVFHAWRRTLPRGVESERDLWTGPPLAPNYGSESDAPSEIEAARAALGFAAGKPLLVVLGGSQGAGALNSFITEHLDLLTRQGLQVLHQTGPGRLEACKSERPGYRRVEFIDDVRTALRAATMVLCRGGASTLAEVAAAKRAAWVVPYPHHKDQHQRKNAEELGLGVQVVDETRLCESLAHELVRQTMPAGLAELARRERILALAMPITGAQRIWSELARLVSPREMQLGS